MATIWRRLKEERFNCNLYFKCFVLLQIFVFYGRCEQPRFPFFMPIPLNPIYVPHYNPAQPEGLVSSPHIIYYLYHHPVVETQSDPLGHYFIRNEEQGFQKWVDDQEDSVRDAPARTPIQDFLFAGAGANLQQDQCGVKRSIFRNIEDSQGNRNTFDFVRDLTRSRSRNQGSVLLKNLDFSGPNTTGTIFQQHSGNSLILETKITYGKETQNNEYPWQVAMFIRGKFHCGASLIGERHVLTAAHCVSAYRTRPHILELSLGDWDLLSTEDGQNVEVEVKKVITHSGFNFLDLQNDIAILELKKKVKFNDRIMPVCLPPADLEVGDGIITITGWGRNEKNKLQSKLQKLDAVSIKNAICSERWTSTGAPRSLIGSRTLCMDTQYGDSCKGDSGGPAVMEYPSGSGKYVQAGIVSFGSGSCTDYHLPGVYTRVASFRNWIIEKMA